MIGGGFYGATVAAHLAARTGRVSLIEAGPHLLGRASFANQARVHAGYHYPRSILTALRSSVNFKRFCATYAEAVDSDFVSLYAIARESKVTASQFATVCEAIEAPVRAGRNAISLRRWFNHGSHVEEVFVTREYVFDAERLRAARRTPTSERAQVDCRTGVSALAVEPVSRETACASLIPRVSAGPPAPYSPVSTPRPTPCSTGPACHAIPLKHELSEIPLLDVGPLKGLGITSHGWSVLLGYAVSGAATGTRCIMYGTPRTTTWQRHWRSRATPTSIMTPHRAGFQRPLYAGRRPPLRPSTGGGEAHGDAVRDQDGAHAERSRRRETNPIPAPPRHSPTSPSS